MAWNFFFMKITSHGMKKHKLYNFTWRRQKQQTRFDYSDAEMLKTYWLAWGSVWELGWGQEKRHSPSPSGECHKERHCQALRGPTVAIHYELPLFLTSQKKHNSNQRETTVKLSIAQSQYCNYIFELKERQRNFTKLAWPSR